MDAAAGGGPGYGGRAVVAEVSRPHRLMQRVRAMTCSACRGKWRVEAEGACSKWVASQDRARFVEDAPGAELVVRDRGPARPRCELRRLLDDERAWRRRGPISVQGCGMAAIWMSFWSRPTRRSPTRCSSALRRTGWRAWRCGNQPASACKAKFGGEASVGAFICTIPSGAPTAASVSAIMRRLLARFIRRGGQAPQH